MYKWLNLSVHHLEVRWVTTTLLSCITAYCTAYTVYGEINYSMYFWDMANSNTVFVRLEICQCCMGGFRKGRERLYSNNCRAVPHPEQTMNIAYTLFSLTHTYTKPIKSAACGHGDTALLSLDKGNRASSWVRVWSIYQHKIHILQSASAASRSDPVSNSFSYAKPVSVWTHHSPVHFNRYGQDTQLLGLSHDAPSDWIKLGICWLGAIQ